MRLFNVELGAALRTVCATADWYVDGLYRRPCRYYRAAAHGEKVGANGRITIKHLELLLSRSQVQLVSPQRGLLLCKVQIRLANRLSGNAGRTLAYNPLIFSD